MKYRIVTILLTAIFLAINAHAQTTPKSALLYKITGKNLKKPSYLFGTFHLACEKDLVFAEKLGGYIAEAEQIILEVDLNDPGIATQRADRVSLKDGKTLKDLLTPEEFTKLDALYKAYLGFSFERLQNMQPIVASIALFMSPNIIGCSPPVVLDMAFAEVAKHRKITVIGLEKAEDQLAIMESSPISEQIKPLKELSSNPDKSIRQFQDLYKVYLSQDSDALYEVISKETALQGSTPEAILDQRNVKWLPLIERHIIQASSFIGVGAGHLGGKKGVVALLRLKGYRVTPIKL